MVCVPFYNSNSEIPYITITRNTSVRFSNIPRVYSDFVECYCSPHSIFAFLCTFISNRAIRNRDSTITFGKGYWPVNHWLFCNYPLFNSGDKPTQNVPLRLILPSIEPYSWCWCLSETHDILLLSLVLILRT